MYREITTMIGECIRLLKIESNLRVCLINNAKYNIIFYAPFLTLDEGQALSEASIRLGQGNVKVHTDLSITHKRLGEKLRDELSKYINVNDINNLSIGLIIVDGVYYIYAPEELVEQSMEYLNGYELFISGIPNIREIEIIENIDILEQLIGNNNTARIEALSTQDYLSNEGVAESDGNKEVDKFKKNEFQYISQRIQFVDVKFQGTRFSQRKISLEEFKTAFGIKDYEILNRFETGWKVFQGDIEINKLTKEINDEIREIKDRFLLCIESYGSIILIKNKFNWENIIKEYKENRLYNIQKETLGKYLEHSKSKLRELLEDAIRKSQRPEEEIALQNHQRAESFMRRIESKFPKAENLISDLDIKMVYYNISPETLKDKYFCYKLASVLNNQDQELSDYLLALSGNNDGIQIKWKI
jgi:hypothetical protein